MHITVCLLFRADFVVITLFQGGVDMDTAAKERE